MKTLNKLIGFAAFFLLANYTASMEKGKSDPQKNLGAILHEREYSFYTFSTKFGLLRFLREDGSLGYPAKSITIDGRLLLSTRGETNKQGGTVSLLTEILSPSASEALPRRPGQTGQTQIKRLVVLVAEDGNCTKHFVILDFTRERPFVSNRFGENPDDRYCLIFNKAKWGKSESLIYLDGPMTYVYSAEGKVFGPVE